MNLLKLLMISLSLLCITRGLSAQDLDRAHAVSSGENHTTDIRSFKGSYALLIGASEYQNKAWKRLPGVKEDIDAVDLALKSQGFETTKVLDPTSAQLVQAYTSFISEHGRDSDNRLLFYFAGHGHTIKKPTGSMGYIVPVDAPGPDAADFERLAMPLQQIDIYAHQIDAKHALFIFDSCFAGTIFADVPQRSGVSPVVSDKMGNPVREFLTSGSADESVPDKSIFREQILLGISGAADSDNDGYVTCEELWTYLESKVTQQRQHPQFGKIFIPGSNTGDFVFIVPGAKRVSKAETSRPVSAAYQMSGSLQQALNLQLGLTAYIDEDKAKQLFIDASTQGDPLATMWIARDTFWGTCGFTLNEGSAQMIAKTVIEDVKTLAKSNNTDAIFLLGEALAYGIGLDKDYTQAVALLRKAAANDHLVAMNMLGYMYSNGEGVPKDYSQAVSYFQHASDKGLPVATINLGLMYRDGTGVSQDYARALELFRSGAEKGKHLGMYDLAGMYRDGLGVHKDANQAITWYSKAAEGGDSASMLELARLYVKTPVADEPQTTRSAIGTTTIKYQTDKAIAWYDKAAEAGDANAIQELADLYLHGANGFTKDPSQVIPLFRKIVAKGNPDGLAFLGWAYDTGSGIAADQVRASYYYKQAADQGNTYSMMRLGQLYYEGKVVPQDYSSAEKYFRQSESTQPDAAIGLGQMYEKGQGVTQDYQQAISWYSKVAYPTGTDLNSQTGNRNAQLALARLYESGPETVRDLSKALKWYRRAAFLGSMEAMDKLAEIYETGKGVEKNSQLAAMWRKNAAGSVKRFTVPCDTANSGKQPFYIYIVEQYPPNEDNPMKDEADRLLLDHGVKLSAEVVDAFSRLLKIARDNNVSFCDLCVYALGTADKETPTDTKKPKTRKSRDFDFMIEDSLRKDLENKKSKNP